MFKNFLGLLIVAFAALAFYRLQVAPKPAVSEPMAEVAAAPVATPDVVATPEPVATPAPAEVAAPAPEPIAPLAAAPVATPVPTPTPLRSGDSVPLPADVTVATQHGSMVVRRGTMARVKEAGDGYAVLAVAGQEVRVLQPKSAGVPAVPSTSEPRVIAMNGQPSTSEAAPAPAMSMGDSAPSSDAMEPPRGMEKAPMKAPPTGPVVAMPTVGIDVKETGSSKGIDTDWKTSYGSYEKNYYRSKKLAISVRNISSRDAGECKVSVMWIGQKVNSRELHVAHMEELPLAMGPMSSAEAEFWCPLIKASDTRLRLLNQRTQTGSTIDGWLAVVWRNGEPISGRGSSPDYFRFLSNGAEMKQLVANYTPDGRVATTEQPRWRQVARGASVPMARPDPERLK